FVFSLLCNLSRVSGSTGELSDQRPTGSPDRTGNAPGLEFSVVPQCPNVTRVKYNIEPKDTSHERTLKASAWNGDIGIVWSTSCMPFRITEDTVDHTLPLVDVVSPYMNVQK